MGDAGADRRSVRRPRQNGRRAPAEHLHKGELDPDLTTRKFRVVAKNGKTYSTLHYNLEAIISVGYRTNSKRATAFRQWAMKVIKEHLQRVGMNGHSGDAQMVDPNNPAQLRKLLTSYTEKVEGLEQQVKHLAPRAAALQRLAKMPGAFGLYDAAKDLQCKPKAFVSRLANEKWIFRRTPKCLAKGRRYSMDAPEPKRQSA